MKFLPTAFQKISKNLQEPIIINQFKSFYKLLRQSQNVVVFSGSGLSVESSVPDFRDVNGTWKLQDCRKLATAKAFRKDPSLIWEFYNYRREIALKASPNKAHLALANYEDYCKKRGTNFTIITQNIDGLHQRAGSKNIIELHGSLHEVKCLRCGAIGENNHSSICEALNLREIHGELEDDYGNDPPVPLDLLPKCSQCFSLVRPNIVFYGECIDRILLGKINDIIKNCSIYILIGTSATSYPAAMFSPYCIEKQIPIIEFNLQDDKENCPLKYHFFGPCSETVPRAFNFV